MMLFFASSCVLTTASDKSAKGKGGMPTVSIIDCDTPDQSVVPCDNEIHDFQENK